jgi:hypothetical protein
MRTLMGICERDRGETLELLSLETCTMIVRTIGFKSLAKKQKSVRIVKKWLYDITSIEEERLPNVTPWILQTEGSLICWCQVWHRR